MKEVLKALRPVKHRIRRNRFLRGAAAGLAAGLAAAAILQAAAFFVPAPDRGLWAAIAAAAVMLLTALGNAARPVKDITAAEAADACGLKERTVTALEGGEEPIRQLQRQDARAALETLDVKKIRPGSVKRALLAALGCAVLLGTLLLIPNARDTEAAARKALNRTLQEGRKTIEQAAEEDEERLPDEKKSELRKITADLNRELGESRDAADALVALDKAEQRLEQMRQETAGDKRDGNGASGEAGSGEKTGNAEGKGEGENAGQAVNGQAGTAASTSAGTAAQLQTLEALTALKGAVNPSLQTGNGIQGIEGKNRTPVGQAGAGTGNGQTGQNGQNGAGGGNNPGGKTGGGAGEGTTNEEQQGGGNSGSGIIKGNRDPRHKEVQYETIYDPEHIDKDKQDVMTEQFRTGDEGSVQIEAGPGRGSLNGDVPWGEALQEYADTEARAADRENLTTQERQWVNDYYKLLTEQQ